MISQSLCRHDIPLNCDRTSTVAGSPLARTPDNQNAPYLYN